MTDEVNQQHGEHGKAKPAPQPGPQSGPQPTTPANPGPGHASTYAQPGYAGPSPYQTYPGKGEQPPRPRYDEGNAQFGQAIQAVMNDIQKLGSEGATGPQLDNINHRLTVIRDALNARGDSPFYGHLNTQPEAPMPGPFRGSK